MNKASTQNLNHFVDDHPVMAVWDLLDAVGQGTKPCTEAPTAIAACLLRVACHDDMPDELRSAAQDLYRESAAQVSRTEGLYFDPHCIRQH